MADLADMLRGLLDDPDTTEKLRGIIGGDQKPSVPDGIDPSLMLKMTKAISAFKSKRDDPRTRLLQDLKPYLSKKRGRRVDEAVEVLSLIAVVDLFKDDFGKD